MGDKAEIDGRAFDRQSCTGLLLLGLEGQGWQDVTCFPEEYAAIDDAVFDEVFENKRRTEEYWINWLRGEP
jgi:hypothetical protein